MTDTATLTLTSFLLARIAEDEAVAQHAAKLGADFIGYDTGERGEGWCGNVGPYDPARVLAECEAKRRIVDYRERVAHESRETGVPLFEAQLSAYDAALRTLAAVYADHPDYREEWKP